MIVSSRHQPTLEAIFADPPVASLRWSEIESPRRALGGEFEADNVGGLVKAFHGSVDDYLEFCAHRGEEPEKPFSGRLLVRLPPDLHRKLSANARLSEKSLNAYIAGVLATAIIDDRRQQP